MKEKFINVHIFLRKPRKFENHSLEKMFKTVIKKKDDRLRFKLLICPFISSGFLNRLFNSLWAFFNQGDVNHITGDVNFISIFLKKEKTINTFPDCYNLRKFSGIKKMIFKFFWFYLPIKNSRYITTISQFSKTELNTFVKVKKKIFVIPAFLPDIKYKLKRSIKRNKILIIGTTENKNIDRILNTIKDLEEEIIIVGKISNKQKNFLKKNKIIYNSYINVSDKKLINIYNQGKILLFPSLYEGFGLPIIEAQRLEVPVITSNISPMKEIANNSALLVNPKNIREIKQKILKLNNNKKLLKDIVKKGYINSLRFKPSLPRNEYFNLYKKVYDSNHIN